jgi:hypothetical protein
MRPLFLALSLLFIPVAFGELVFEKSVHDIEAKTGETQALAEYIFTNNSNNPVAIREIKTGCDCTTATMTKSTFAPGEQGRISVLFKFGDRVGEQRKTITIQTDDPKQPEVLLGFNVMIPQMWTVSPRFLYWREGQGGQSQTVEIKVGGETSRKLVSAEILEGDVKVELREEEPGKRYTLIVTPLDINKPTRAMILVRPEDKTLPLVPVIYASVIGKEPPR